jgi:GNAT superfamily N-acetyltransferase
VSRTTARLATAAEADAVARTLALSFSTDPVWGSWAFPDPGDRVERLTRYWAPFVAAGLKYDGVWTTDDGGAVAIWVPPGVAEMDADDEAATATMLAEVCGARAAQFFETYDRFEGAHPLEDPFWYLSLLATHPDHRGRGLGMAMVEDHLETVDAAHVPAYLESTNDGNLARYGRVGFAPYGSFDVPAGPTVTTMWRPAR